MKTTKFFSISEGQVKDILKVWTDGASQKVNKSKTKFAIGIFWDIDSDCNISKYAVINIFTNNIEELEAILEALKIAIDLDYIVKIICILLQKLKT